MNGEDRAMYDNPKIYIRSFSISFFSIETCTSTHCLSLLVATIVYSTRLIYFPLTKTHPRQDQHACISPKLGGFAFGSALYNVRVSSLQVEGPCMMHKPQHVFHSTSFIIEIAPPKFSLHSNHLWLLFRLHQDSYIAQTSNKRYRQGGCFLFDQTISLPSLKKNGC